METHHFLKSKWEKIFGKSNFTDSTFDELTQIYSAPRRKYHNLNHIETMLKNLEARGGEFSGSIVMNLAIWFHDSVIYFGLPGNEGRSAAQAENFANKIGLEQRFIDKVKNMILLTGARPPIAPDDETGLFLDLDYFILAADPKNYAQYAIAVGREFPCLYRRFIFQKLRILFLKKTLKRRRIFFTDSFSSFEENARKNINSEIGTLTRGAEKWRDPDYAPVEISNECLTKYLINEDGVAKEYKILLQDVQCVRVFKRDRFAWDEVFMVFITNSASSFVSEEALGSQKVFMQLEHLLPGTIPFKEWFLKVTSAPFEMNLTEIFWRGGLEKNLEGGLNFL